MIELQCVDAAIINKLSVGGKKRAIFEVKTVHVDTKVEIFLSHPGYLTIFYHKISSYAYLKSPNNAKAVQEE